MTDVLRGRSENVSRSRTDHELDLGLRAHRHDRHQGGDRGAGSLCGTLTYPVATRIAIPSLKIDLPVVKPPSGYPLCNVAMYYPTLSQPREGGVSFIYAHARVGMFLPLLERSKINNGASLLGATILVWTSNDLVSTYDHLVRRHASTFWAGAFRPRHGAALVADVKGKREIKARANQGGGNGTASRA